MAHIKGQELISSTQVRGYNTQFLISYYIHGLNSLILWLQDIIA